MKDAVGRVYVGLDQVGCGDYSFLGSDYDLEVRAVDRGHCITRQMGKLE